MQASINWKVFLILLALSLISVICVFPYVLTVQGEAISSIDVPIRLLFIAQFIQSLILFSITISLGLFFTKKVNFRLPLLEAISQKRGWKKALRSILGQSIVLGAIAAVIIYVLDFLFTAWGVAISTHQSYAPVWQKLLAAAYGGVAEEVIMRLFLMTFFIWLGSKLFKSKQPATPTILVAIFLTAIIFGLGHLPITASITKLDAFVITRAIVLNGVGGIIFGWLFWKKGLESAMIAHFTTDIFLLTLLPLILK